MFIEWDGTVLPCYRDRIVLGNLEEQTFAQIWNGDPMQRHRRTFLDRQLTEFCARCQAFFCGHA